MSGRKIGRCHLERGYEKGNKKQREMKEKDKVKSTFKGENKADIVCEGYILQYGRERVESAFQRVGEKKKLVFSLGGHDG